MKEQYAIGVDLGGTKVKLGIVTSSGRIVKKLSIPTLANEGAEKSISQIIKGIYGSSFKSWAKHMASN